MFLEQLPQRAQHLAAHVAGAILRVFDRHVDRHVDAAGAQRGHRHRWSGIAQHARGGAGGLQHQLFRHVDIGAIGHADRDGQHDLGVGIGPVLDLGGHEDFVWDQVFAVVARRHRYRADADLAHLAHGVALAIVDGDHVTGLDRAVHQQDQPGNQVAERLLQAKADGEAKGAGKHRQRGEVDPQQVDAHEERQRPDHERDDLFTQHLLHRIETGGTGKEIARQPAAQPRQHEHGKDHQDHLAGVEHRDVVVADVKPEIVERLEEVGDLAVGLVADPAAHRAAAQAASACSRSAIRSSASSSPMARRTP